jgi:hypothetical protein
MIVSYGQAAFLHNNPDAPFSQGAARAKALAGYSLCECGSDDEQAVVFLRRQVQNGLEKGLQNVQARRLTEKQLGNQVI